MAELSEQQHEILSNMRERGLDTEAAKLQGLYAQLIERPNSEQLIELTSQMVRQYIGPGREPVPFTKSDPDDLLHQGPSCDDCPIQEPGESEATYIGRVREHRGLTPLSIPVKPETCGVDHTHATHTAEEAEPEKVRIELVDFDFIIEMARFLQAGLADTYDPPRKPGDWQKYTASELEERRGSLLRHYAAGEWGSVAVNAMILWWHSRKNRNGS